MHHGALTHYREWTHPGWTAAPDRQTRAPSPTDTGNCCCRCCCSQSQQSVSACRTTAHHTLDKHTWMLQWHHKYCLKADLEIPRGGWNTFIVGTVLQFLSVALRGSKDWETGHVHRVCCHGDVLTMTQLSFWNRPQINYCYGLICNHLLISGLSNEMKSEK